MSEDSTNWQTWVALGIVAATLILFLLRARKKEKSGGCHNCGPGKDCQ